MRSITLFLAVAVLPIQLASAQSAKVKWGPAPAVFPAGAKMAVMAGDPSKAGIFTARLDLPKGYRVAPHFHPTDEYLTVISGTFLLGMGDKLDAKKTEALSAGGFGTVSAQKHHYAIAKTHTVVQVNGMGPFQLTYVNPADDPTRKAVAKH